MADEGLQNDLDQLRTDMAKLRADLSAIGDGVKKMGTEAVGATQAKVKSAAQDALDVSGPSAAISTTWPGAPKSG